MQLEQEVASSAAKTTGRVTALQIDEGEFVKADNLLARLDTAVLAAQMLNVERPKRRPVSSTGGERRQACTPQSRKAAER